jgi:hypothetical protein
MSFSRPSRWIAQSAIGIVLIAGVNLAFSSATPSGRQATAQAAPKPTGGKCPSGYVIKGDACQDINECENGNGGCDVLTMCTNTPGGRTCGQCPDGHQGDGYIGCVDVNDCADGDCSGILERRARQRDTIPPVITTSGDVTVNANSSAGSVVNFKVSAKDNVDGNVTVFCTPASGTTFPVGATKVTCTAADKKGNKGSATITINVVQPEF